MSDKLASNRVVKIGIVCDDVEAAAARYLDLFNTLPSPRQEETPATTKPFIDCYKEYRGVKYDNVPLKVKNIYIEPVYFELIQPADNTPSPWRDHLDRFGNSVCFVSFYIEGFEQQIDMLGQKGYPMIFKEEKGFERYAYFDTLDKLGIMLEIKEKIPKTMKI